MLNSSFVLAIRVLQVRRRVVLLLCSFPSIDNAGLKIDLILPLIVSLHCLQAAFGQTKYFLLLISHVHQQSAYLWSQNNLATSLVLRCLSFINDSALLDNPSLEQKSLLKMAKQLGPICC